MLCSIFWTSSDFTHEGIAFLTLYFVALLVFDRYLSARSSRDWLIRYLKTLRCVGKDCEASQCSKPGIEQCAISDELEELGATGNRIGKFWQFLKPISTSKVLSGWRFAHSIAVKRVSTQTQQEVRAKLERIPAQLSDLTRPDAGALAKKIEQILVGGPSTALGAYDPGKATEKLAYECAVLQEALIVIYDERDSRYGAFSGLQSKSVWLAIFGIFLIVLGGIVLHREVLFFFGVLGAFVSRLSSIRSRTPMDTDYGASTGRLLVSPIAGALSGWLGVLVVSQLSGPPFNILNKQFANVWTTPLSRMAFVIAVVFGFSERLLNRLLRSAADKIDPPSSTTLH
jgi:hypothetical protein